MKKLRVGVVGVGHIGKNHARLYAELSGAQFTAIYDTDQARAHQLADEFGIVAAPSLEEFTQEVDAASIATPTNTHFDIARTADAGQTSSDRKTDRGKHSARERIGGTRGRSPARSSSWSRRTFQSHLERARKTPDESAFHRGASAFSLSEPQHRYRSRARSDDPRSRDYFASRPFARANDRRGRCAGLESRRGYRERTAPFRKRLRGKYHFQSDQSSRCGRSVSSRRTLISRSIIRTKAARSTGARRMG